MTAWNKYIKIRKKIIYALDKNNIQWKKAPCYFFCYFGTMFFLYTVQVSLFIHRNFGNYIRINLMLYMQCSVYDCHRHVHVLSNSICEVWMNEWMWCFCWCWWWRVIKILFTIVINSINLNHFEFRSFFFLHVWSQSNVSPF